MYSNGYQTNTSAGSYPQSTAPQYEHDVSDAVSGPSLAIAHQEVDDAIKRVAGIASDLTDTAERVLGPSLKGAGDGQAEPSVSGTLPGLLQKLSWLHNAITGIEVQSTRLRAL